MPYFEVEKYQVFKFADPGLENATAIIHAMGEGQHADIVFIKQNAKIPKSHAGTFYFHEKEFPAIIDLMRNERPVHLNTEGVFFILTEQEGVGEHEVGRADRRDAAMSLRPNGVDLRGLAKGVAVDPTVG